jgi:3-(3-hydroxy-phenyl)propionate hydroxylase
MSGNDPGKPSAASEPLAGREGTDPAPLEADVAIVGAGPVGLTLASILGAHGVSVRVIERLEGLIDYPRAIGIDDESLRTLQGVGLAERVQAHITPDHWMRFTTADGRIFASIEPRTDEFGWSRRNAFIQPQVDRILFEGLSRFPGVQVLFGQSLAGFAQDDDGVTLELEAAGAPQAGQAEAGAPGAGIRAGVGEAIAADGPARRRLRVRWLVGCDGGNSFVRRTLGVGFEGRTKPNRWVVLDLRNDPLGTPHIYLHCDPQRPWVSAALPHGIRRFEFMVMPDETEETLAQPGNLARLLAGIVPDPAAVDPIRLRIYTHNARLAERFRIGRVLLAGDAAHIMPVWQGQGYNSGLRDASNLGWKLALVTRGLADEGLLDTYGEERRPHARAMIHLSEVAGDIFSPESATAARARDNLTRVLDLVPAWKQYFVEMRFKPMPRYEQGAIVAPPQPPRQPTPLAGLLERAGDHPLGRLLGLMADKRESLVGRLVHGLDVPPDTPVGRMFIQPRVLCEDGATRRLDDVIGPGFAVIAWGTDPTHGLSEAARATWARLGAVFVRAVPSVQMAHAADARSGVIRVGDPANRLKDWFARWPKSVVFVRPDRFVGALCAPQEISATTLAFARALRVPTGSPP